MCGNIQFRRGMCSCLLEERVSICGHLNLPFGLSWHSLDPETTEILYEPQARFAEKGESIINCRHSQSNNLEINGSGSCLGYRSMTRRLQHDYHLLVGKHVVRTLLQNIDLYGVNQRRRRRLERRCYRNPGPNGAWHIDGYGRELVAPYGFHISGFIDCYSRRIMFLQVAAISHDPGVIVYYYLRCVKQIQGCPRLVQTDCGTENVVVAAIQGVFCINASRPFDGPNSHRYGSSPSNQRIEAWWSYYRKQNSGW